MLLSSVLQSPASRPSTGRIRDWARPSSTRAQTTPRHPTRCGADDVSKSFEVVTWNSRPGRVITRISYSACAAARKSPMPLRTPPRRSIDDECCSICLEPLNDDKQKIHVLQTCSHRFHLDCIKRRGSAWRRRAARCVGATWVRA